MNPPSHGSSWSELPADLLHSALERLGFADFQRAKSVCSSWQSASRQSAPNYQIPWLIQFPEKGKDYCLLLNPQEKDDKMYKIRDLGVNFANSHCLVTYGSWLLMRDPRHDLYIFNIFTRERIDLPSVESQLGVIQIERTLDDMFFVKLSDDDADIVWHDTYIEIGSPLFWMDEKTKDFVVMWITECRDDTVFVHSRNGDNFWKQTKLFRSVVDMVYKDHKLYLYEYSRDVKILDFSGDSPRQIIFETQVKRRPFKMPRRVYPELGDVWNIKKNHLVVTVTGEILRVKSIVRNDSHVWSFRIYKMDSSKGEWEKLTSLGDEAILLDLGITLLANTIQGIKRNSIYFSGDHDRAFTEFDRVWSEEDILIFDLDTHMVERPHRRSICSSIRTSNARWFVPNSKPR